MLVLFVLCAFIPICAQEGYSIVTTNSILYDFAKHISPQKNRIKSLIPVGGDPHLYDPVPKDVEAIAQAHLVIKNGLHLEGWLDKVIDNSGTKALITEAAEYINPIQAKGYDNSFDPHAWMNIENGLQYAQNILAAFIAIDPENKAYYQHHYSILCNELEQTHEQIIQIINSIDSSQRILITSHDAFAYFAKAYDIKVYSMMGISTEAEVQTRDLNALIEIIKSNGIKAIFAESTINPKLLNQLAQDLGISIGGELFADSLDDPDQEAGTYIGMMLSNAKTIARGLSGNRILVKDKAVTKEFIVVLFIALFLVLCFVGFKTKTKSITIRPKHFSITIEDLNVSYDSKTILSNIYLELKNYNLYGIIGANGSGKSTLLKSILGLVKADSGKIYLDQQPLQAFGREIAYIPQKDEIDTQFPVTVEDIVLMGRNADKKVYQSYSNNDYAKVDDALHSLGLDKIRKKQIGEISGGQLQRVFIARAICQDAKIFFLDEPFVGVDITTEEKIIEILKALVAEGKMVVIIHHDLSKVERYFDKIIMMNQRVVSFGSVEEVFTTQNIEKTFGGQLPILHKKDALI